MKNERIPMRLRYLESAPENDDFIPKYQGNGDPKSGWEKWSLPVGCGWFGVNVFGRTVTERLQVTENSLCNPGAGGGLNNLCELLIDIGHTEVSDYERSLDLDDGCARVRYMCGGVTYGRELFASYPDRILAVRFSASEAGRVSFTLRPQIPFLKESEKGYSKRGSVTASGDTVTLSGVMEYYGIAFEGQMRVLHTGGRLTASDGTLRLEGADSAAVICSFATNYRLESRVFTEPDPKKKLAPYPHPHATVTRLLDAACEKGYDTLYSRHAADYGGLMHRVRFETEPAGMELPTDELLVRYAAGERLGYLEMLYFQYGRHLLISSSRPGTLPANLQGVWNCYDESPWGSGYWHNINVQMNYWPAFPANLAECFEAYAAYAEAYLPQAKKQADDYIRWLFPEKLGRPGENGWILGTACRPYEISTDLQTDPVTGEVRYGHSGPGVGAFTSILFWEYYAFTGDRGILRRYTWPMVRGMAQFLEKTVEDHDGLLLAEYSASPEQMVEGRWRPGGHYYHTHGCGFDQQLIWENHRDLLLAAELLGENDEATETAREQLPRLDPVQVGTSGQVKEYREENGYGEIGEWHHRHISHLCGLYPGSVINRNTPEWMDAARVTLELRGDRSTGWAMAHRLNAWARVMDGDRAHAVYRTLLSQGTFPNLWDAHPPFQIDGNFGGVSGVCEMLLQSQAGFIDLLPALPKEWESGCFEGLVARGNVVTDCEWEKGMVKSLTLTVRTGGNVRLHPHRLPEGVRFAVNGAPVSPLRDEEGVFAFAVSAGDVITAPV